MRLVRHSSTASRYLRMGEVAGHHDGTRQRQARADRVLCSRSPGSPTSAPRQVDVHDVRRPATPQSTSGIQCAGLFSSCSRNNAVLGDLAQRLPVRRATTGKSPKIGSEAPVGRQADHPHVSRGETILPPKLARRRRAAASSRGSPPPWRDPRKAWPASEPSVGSVPGAASGEAHGLEGLLGRWCRRSRTRGQGGQGRGAQFSPSGRPASAVQWQGATACAGKRKVPLRWPSRRPGDEKRNL